MLFLIFYDYFEYEEITIFISAQNFDDESADGSVEKKGDSRRKGESPNL